MHTDTHRWDTDFVGILFGCKDRQKKMRKREKSKRMRSHSEGGFDYAQPPKTDAPDFYAGKLITCQFGHRCTRINTDETRIFKGCFLVAKTDKKSGAVVEVEHKNDSDRSRPKGVGFLLRSAVIFVKHRNGRHRFLRRKVDNLSVWTQMNTDEHR